MIDVTIQHVHAINRNSIPPENITIMDDLSEFFSEIVNLHQIKKLEIYYRAPEDCPFARGNWICDIYVGNRIFAIKLPKEMSEGKVLKYFEPLIMHLKSNASTVKYFIH